LAVLRPQEGLRRGENFWLRLTTASTQCLLLSAVGTFFFISPLFYRIVLQVQKICKIELRLSHTSNEVSKQNLHL